MLNIRIYIYIYICINYISDSFENLDAAVMIESGHSIFDIIYSITVIVSGLFIEINKEAYLTEPSEYFFLFDSKY